ncbi:hypothetical protein ACFV2N_35005 [Streptomyces sp. NPDC059680]|uniref:hypothetical protein n=1 Tax=Streptomyces TaxID=1883 RepID=UPI001E2E4C0C|nr:hypothetical protein [Streptomyces barringtoniae]MCC5474087.1 hypothetical protein [Streptomyces barringtoniae]
MHRTTTAAALLVTVAVSALSGCVTVPRPAPPRDTAPSLPTAPRPDGTAEPRAVQAPAQEALERTEPSRRPRPVTPATPHRMVEAPPVVHHPPAAPPLPSRPRMRPRQSHTAAPDLPNAAPKAPNVCALGRQYGGWRADSPEAKICEQTYGH